MRNKLSGCKKTLIHSNTRAGMLVRFISFSFWINFKWRWNTTLDWMQNNQGLLDLPKRFYVYKLLQQAGKVTLNKTFRDHNHYWHLWSFFVFHRLFKIIITYFDHNHNHDIFDYKTHLHWLNLESWMNVFASAFSSTWTLLNEIWELHFCLSRTGIVNLHFWPCWGSTKTEGRCQIIHVMRVLCWWWGSCRFCIVQPVGEGEEPALFCTLLFVAASLPLICAPKMPRIWKGILKLKLQCSIVERNSKAKVEKKQKKRKERIKGVFPNPGS